MPNLTKQLFLEKIEERFGKLKKLQHSQSLFDLQNGKVRLYYRYSKIHNNKQAFFGLRRKDINQLYGHNSLLFLSWNNQKEPLIIPYMDIEETLNNIAEASDGQIKTSVYFGEQIELYMPGAGRINIESYFGWNQLYNLIDKSGIKNLPEFSHAQIQTLIGSIGKKKGYDIWIPQNNRLKLDWNLTKRFKCKNNFPERFKKIQQIISEIDVIWIQKGSSIIKALFEVEHSTPIYTGLLRFNDLHLIEPNLNPKYSIVSNELRKSLFLKQINRPTFKTSGLIDYCNFLEYKDVFAWHNRIKNK